MAEKAEMKISGVEVAEYSLGIPLSGWKSVRNTLELLNSAAEIFTLRTGREKPGIFVGDERFARSDFEEAVANAGVIISNTPLGIYDLVLEKTRQIPFVDKLIEEAQSRITANGRLWTTDSQFKARSNIANGAVFGSLLTIRKIREIDDAYLLDTNPEDAEDHLADILGMEKGLYWLGVMVGIEPVGSNFTLDFDQVVKIIAPVLADLDKSEGKNGITGDNIAKTLYEIAMRDNPDHYTGPSSISLGERDGLALEMRLESAGGPVKYGYRLGDEIFWKVDGPVLTGPVAYDLLKKDVQLTPTIVFGIHGVDEHKTLVTAVDPTTKQAMYSLAETLAASFRQF